MNLLTGRLPALGIGIVLIILLSGCQSDKIGIHYTPQKNVAAITGADHVPVKIDVVDQRTNKSIGYAIEQGDGFDLSYQVDATNDVASVVRNAIQNELTSRGFKLAETGAAVLVGIKSFYGDTTLRGAIVTLSVQVEKPDKDILYSNLITGKRWVNVFTHWNDGKAIQGSLDTALQRCIAQLFADPKFTNALLNASG